MIIFNPQSLSDGRQHSVGYIEECVRRGIILWSEPFPFHDAPKSFCNIQMRGIWRDVEKKKASFFPYSTHLLNFCIPVNTGVIKHNKRLFFEPKGKLVKKIYNLSSVNRLTSTEPFETILTINHSEDIKPFGSSFRRYIYILSCKLPSIRHITFCTDMGFITIEKTDFSFSIKYFKFLQLRGFVLIELRRGNSPWTFPYTSISCAKADKKRLNVNSLASLPDAFCHASLAERTLWRSNSIALRTTFSSEQSMMGFRPRPGRVCKPLMPSDSNRFTQPLTLWTVIPVRSPTQTELSPSDLSRMARQRIRNTWLSPCRKPTERAERSESVNIKILIFIFVVLYKVQRWKINYM